MNLSKYRWPLSDCSLTLLDRARIAWWILSQDRYTMGAKVVELEAAFSQLSGMHAVMVANGSVANQLVFELWKLKHPGVTPVVIAPAVTWISSLTPALLAGMDVVPCDVNLEDLAFDYDHLANLLDRHANRHVIIWPTALIGFVPDMARIHRLAAKHPNAEVFLDSCENTFSRVPNEERLFIDLHNNPTSEASILATASMTTTSIYHSHHVSGVEGGFVFFRDKTDADLARMFRNHGMIRSLAVDHPLRKQIEADNPTVDPQFLFAVPGSNFRASDVHAMFGLQDVRRIEQNTNHRKHIYKRYENLLDRSAYYLPPSQKSHVAFCLPIFVRNQGPSINKVKEALKAAGIETRPLVGSFLGKQPALKHLFEMPSVYPNAEWIHDHACYIGIHKNVTDKMVDQLIDVLNNVADQG